MAGVEYVASSARLRFVNVFLPLAAASKLASHSCLAINGPDPSIYSRTVRGPHYDVARLRVRRTAANEGQVRMLGRWCRHYTCLFCVFRDYTRPIYSPRVVQLPNT